MLESQSACRDKWYVIVPDVCPLDPQAYARSSFKFLVLPVSFSHTIFTDAAHIMDLRAFSQNQQSGPQIGGATDEAAIFS
jgi:hypothetical protein